MEIKEELVYEYWDCKYCGQKAIRGDHDRCTSCGHDRDKDITFYRQEQAEELVQDQAQAARFQAGADWVCGFCKTLNSATLNACRSCGAARSDAKGDYFDAQREKEAREAKGAPSPEELKRTGGKVLRNLGIFLLMLIGSCYWCTRTHDVQYEVRAAHWQRSIAVERYAWAERTDWDDELKGEGVERISSSREVRRTEQREVGRRTESYTEDEEYQSGTKKKCSTSYESTGSGASKKKTTCEDEPVYSKRAVRKTRTVPVYKDFPIYGDKVRYRSKAYTALRTESASGDDNAPRWPDAKLGTGEDGKADREASRSEDYQVWLRKLDKGAKGPEELHLKTQEASFVGVYKVGSKVPMKIDNMGSPTLPPGDEQVRDKDK